MNYAGIIEDDIADSTDGVCVSLWFNGCDIRCPGCHNKGCWDAKSEVPNEEVAQRLITLLDEAWDRGILKSLSILGGEPLSVDNRKDCYEILHQCGARLPHVGVRLWTGRTKEQLIKLCEEDYQVAWVLNRCSEIIVGPFIEELKENLPLRGSSNQEILVNGKDYKILNFKQFTLINGD